MTAELQSKWVCLFYVEVWCAGIDSNRLFPRLLEKTGIAMSMSHRVQVFCDKSLSWSIARNP